MLFLNQLLQAFAITGPVLIILLIGVLLKRTRLLNAEFITGGNKLVFNVTLPSFLFLSVSTSSSRQGVDLNLLTFAVIATLLSVVILWVLMRGILVKGQVGVFVQCAFRGNMAIVGLALCLSAFGDEVLTLAAGYLAVLTILYNILSVILLSDNKISIFNNVLKNPLIIAICSGAMYSFSGIPLPKIIHASLKYLSAMTLPLALLCIGASLDWQSFRNNRSIAMYACSLKLVVLPGLIIAIAIACGFRNDSLGVLFFMMASPTAAAAYIMSRQMSDHGNLAAEIITLTTSLCPISLTLGLALLKYFQLV